MLQGFYSPDEAGEMLSRARQLLDEFDVAGHPMVCLGIMKEVFCSHLQTTFKTEDDGEHVGDDYFLNSGDKVGFSCRTTHLPPTYYRADPILP